MSWRKGLVWKWFIWDVILEDKREQGRSGKDTVATSFVRTEGFIEWRYLEKGQAVLPELSSRRNGGRTALPWLLPEGQVLEVLVFWVCWCQSPTGSRSIYPTCIFLRQGKIHGVDMKKCLDSFASLTDVQGLCLGLEGTQFFSASVENSSHSKWKKKSQIWVIASREHGLFKLPQMPHFILETVLRSFYSYTERGKATNKGIFKMWGD